ncbi:adaptin N terminal region-domain-containing protein [Tuber brumale]|nr:adaptin N terminal region-domain-containing protein [Tuber brumale]
MSSMRGLVQFIADLRNARARELEEKRINKELANIRLKKYVCKLLYIYILGWNVDFGHLEAVNLISATKYSEKQIGYLAVTLFLNEKHDFLHLVVNSIKKDLLDHNELNNCLALHAIANVGGREMGEALSPDVHRLLISPTSKSFVKKKAALTLLRLYRKYPGIIQSEWAERIISLMDDPDLGVALSVTSLVMASVQDNPDAYKGSYVKAAHRLKRVVVDNEYTPDYVYYKVPCPWIQVKLLRLLQYYPPSDDINTQNMIRESLQRILDTASDAPKNVQQNNAQNAVLFEAINLAIHLDSETGLMTQIAVRLGRFIVSKETNVRYLGLEAMTHLAARSETLEPIKKHQSTIIASLRDRDISVRRKALDLLYSMCDPTNSQPIVSELLKYLQSADFAIREEMVLKIAILTEKYATEFRWYVDISLRLISMAGDHVSDEVWQRVIQIVTNNEELQVYAAQNILQHVKGMQCHETLVKIGGYLLGEFGHLIADNPGCSPIEQFMALQSKFNGCSSATRAILLSTYIKFINLFPEIKPQLMQIFNAYSHTLDPELQQRACEYLALASLPSDDLLRTKHAGTSDKRTWVIGGKDANTDRKEFALTLNTGLKRSFTNGAATPTASDGGLRSTTKTTALAGLDLNGEPPKKAAINLASATHLSPDWHLGYNRLVIRSEGVLYEDVQIQVGLRSEYRTNMGCVILYYTNKSSVAIGSFTATINNNSPGLVTIITQNTPDPIVPADGQIQQTLMLESTGVFPEAPTIRISYLAGALQALTLKLPVILTKFMEPAELSSEDFFKRWKQIGGAREAQKVFGIAVKGHAVELSRTRKVLEGFRWGVLDGVDPNKKNFVGASVLHTTCGKFGCLLRLEPNLETNMYRLTIRATDEKVPPPMLKVMEDRLSLGSPAPDHSNGN